MATTATSARGMQTNRGGARARILETAERLFYAEGIRNVGIDRIIAEAGVAKMSLYNHFASKDDLILAVLEHRETQVFDMFRSMMDRHIARGKSPLEAYFDALYGWFKSKGFRGCSFINASVELANAEHPGALFSAEYKKRHAELVKGAIEASAGRKATSAAPAVSLLVDGAIVQAQMTGSATPARTAKAAAMELVVRAKRR